MKSITKKEESMRLNATFDEIIKASSTGSVKPKPKGKKPAKKSR